MPDRRRESAARGKRRNRQNGRAMMHPARDRPKMLHETATISGADGKSKEKSAGGRRNNGCTNGTDSAGGVNGSIAVRIDHVAAGHGRQGTERIQVRTRADA